MFDFLLPSSPEAAGKPVTFLGFFDPRSKHQNIPTPATKNPITVQPNTNTLVVISPPLESLQDRPGIHTNGFVFSTPKTSLVNPEIYPMGQTRNIDEGCVFQLRYHPNKLNTTLSFVSESAAKLVSQPNTTSTGISAAKTSWSISEQLEYN